MRWSARNPVRWTAAGLAAVAAAAVPALAGVTPATGAVGPADWPAFLAGPAHTSDNRAQVAITPGNVGALVLKWHFVGDQPNRPGQPRPAYNASPTVADGAVYVGAPDGYLYALRASDLSRKWRSVIAIPSATVSDYFQWSSPTVSGGRIYIGVSSHCDNPLVRGGVIGYVQAPGKIFARSHDVPKGVD